METFIARGLLFDMDGTLLDSIPAARRAWGTWADEMGLEGEFILDRIGHGRQRPDIIAALFPDRPRQWVDEQAERIRIAERDDTTDVVALPGARELLDSLPENAWAIVTSCDEETALARLRAAGLPTPAVLIPADLVSRSKPDPEGFQMGAQKLGFSPDECMVFEDAPAGVQAATAAGMRVVVTRYTHDDDALHGATAIVDNPSGVRVEATADGLAVIVEA